MIGQTVGLGTVIVSNLPLAADGLEGNPRGESGTPSNARPQCSTSVLDPKGWLSAGQRQRSPRCGPSRRFGSSPGLAPMFHQPGGEWLLGGRWWGGVGLMPWWTSGVVEAAAVRPRTGSSCWLAHGRVRPRSPQPSRGCRTCDVSCSTAACSSPRTISCGSSRTTASPRPRRQPRCWWVAARTAGRRGRPETAEHSARCRKPGPSEAAAGRRDDDRAFAGRGMPRPAAPHRQALGLPAGVVDLLARVRLPRREDRYVVRDAVAAMPTAALATPTLCAASGRRRPRKGQGA